MDAALLAQVYVELLGERQATLGLAERSGGSARARIDGGKARQRPEPLPSRLTPEQIAAHKAFVGTLGPDALWLKYMPADPAAEAK
ncbi:hypothetical protein AAEH76_22020, partial [Shewanella algae]|uniref:hypothetical protein n=1 Tax=Shewanella algae TaxID=38313 RepID=UPI00313F5635